MKRVLIIIMALLCISSVCCMADATTTEKGKIVFLSDKGNDSNSGETDQKPKKTLNAAIKALGDDGGTVVVCGSYTHKKGSAKLPKHAEQIKITAKNGTKKYSGKFKVQDNLLLGGKTVIENISLNFSASTAVFCCGYDTIFGEGIDVTYSDKYAPNIFGGKDCSSQTATLSSFTMQIDSGKWGKIYCGNYRNAVTETMGKLTGDTTLTINGGTFLDSVAATGSENRSGNAKLVINGGDFRCSVLGIAEPSTAYGSKIKYEGSIDITINGGVFSGDIAVAARPEETTLIGSCDIRLRYGDYSRVNLIEGAEGCVNYADGRAAATLHISDAIDINAEQIGQITFRNNIANFADPSVLYHDGWYYYTYAKDYMGKTAVWVRRAANFSDISASRPVLVWAEAIDPTGMKNLWAPQITFLEGRFYLYATCAYYDTANELGVTPRKPVVFLSNDANDPLAGFTYRGPMDNVDPEVFMYLSPRFINWNGKTYMINGGFFREEDRVPDVKHFQTLFITEMASPTAFTGKAVAIARATERWEISNGGKCEILEGPFAYVSKVDGKLYVLYSANETASDNYCTGLLRFNGTAEDEITNTSLWYKYPKPIQQKDTSIGIYSPGAMVLTPSPDGEQLWMIYHAKLKSGYTYNGRILFAQPLVTDENGVPQFSPLKPLTASFSYTMNRMPLSKRIEGFGSISYISVPSLESEEETQNTENTDDLLTTPPAVSDSVSISDSEALSTTSPEPTETKTHHVPLTVAAVVGAAAVGAAAVIVAIKKKKKQ